jgi:acyl-coenzyme A synthetase/AMP-(fatty) acid ligase
LELAGPAVTLPDLRWLLLSGEAFPPELCRRWMERFPHIRLLNAYGPAECSDDVSYHVIAKPAAADLTVPIGKPVDNTQLYLLDRWLEPLPVGVAGEICVGGVQVGRGYLNRPALTAEVFVPNPFGAAGERLYRTGDLGRYLPDGSLEFLGRIDHQVKIRGHRIEPGEIEACLASYPGVAAAVVVPREVAEGIYRLVAYVAGAGLEAGELRAHVLKTLPDYMVPAAFVFLDDLPLAPGGKIDRKRLPDPDISAQLAHQYVAPRNHTEETLAAIWAELLRVSQVGVHDNFFELGGHSLLATQVASRIRGAFAVDLPLRTLFESTTVAGLADAVDIARLLKRQESVNDAETAASYEDIEL